MTTKEVANQLGCAVMTILNHAKRVLPNKVIENGKPAQWNEAEVTVLLESIKHAHSGGENNAGETLKTSLEGVETSMTPALKLMRLTALIENAHKEIEAIKDAEIARLKAENESQAITLSESREWWSVKRVMIETGKEYPWKPLRGFSMAHGYAIEKTFDKNYGEVNAYHIDVWNAVYGVEL
jgi:hypothetical protein